MTELPKQIELPLMTVYKKGYNWDLQYKLHAFQETYVNTIKKELKGKLKPIRHYCERNIVHNFRITNKGTVFYDTMFTFNEGRTCFGVELKAMPEESFPPNEAAHLSRGRLTQYNARYYVTLQKERHQKHWVYNLEEAIAILAI